MQTRKDGEQTRRRLLDAACRIFAEKGYREATNAQICELAKANIAAINYHFGSKADLYRNAWLHGADCAEKLYPLDGGLAPDTPAKNRLHALILALLRRRFDRERLGHFHKIRMSEMFAPTGILDEVMSQRLLRLRKYILGVIAEIMGPEIATNTLELCERSIVSQCFLPTVKPGGNMAALSNEADSEFIEMLAKHVFQFSLAGLRHIRSRAGISRKK